MSADFCIAQISDLHISATPDGRARDVHGIDTPTRLHAVLDAIANHPVQAILATGDLVDTGTAEDYALLREALLRAPVPVYLMPGNHDHPQRLKAAFPDHAYLPNTDDLSFCIDEWPVRVIMLDDTTTFGEDFGVMTQAKADWLDAALRKAPDTPTLLALHHPPILIGDPMFDTIGLHQPELLEAVVRTHRQVRLIACGHAHRAIFGSFADRPVFICPSSAWQFQFAHTLEQSHFPATHERPGFALHRATRDGAIVTTTFWI